MVRGIPPEQRGRYWRPGRPPRRRRGARAMARALIVATSTRQTTRARGRTVWALPGHTAIEQSAPSKPASHWHTPSTHTPRREQPFAQPRSAQDKPWYGGKQKHAPSTHEPCPEQLRSGPSQVGSAQLGPDQPASHSHVASLAHRPWLEHLSGQTRSPQLCPANPGEHSHTEVAPSARCTQRPRPRQSSGQRRRSQWRPVKPGTQRQVPSTHSPCSPQPPMHVG